MPRRYLRKLIAMIDGPGPLTNTVPPMENFLEISNIRIVSAILFDTPRAL